MIVYYARTDSFSAELSAGDVVAISRTPLAHKESDPQYESAKVDMFDPGGEELRFFRRGKAGPVRKPQDEIDSLLAMRMARVDMERGERIAKFLKLAGYEIRKVEK